MDNENNEKKEVKDKKPKESVVSGVESEKEFLNRCSVPEFITWAADKFPRQQKDISIKLGYAFNALYLMKSGQFKIPVERIFDIADALHVDPVFFRNKLFQGYFPNYFKREQELMDTHHCYPFEREVLALIREKGVKFASMTQTDKDKLIVILDEIKERRRKELAAKADESI